MSIYDDRPIGDIYVEWANSLDSTGKDSGPARVRLMTIDTVVKMKSMMTDIMWASERADHVKKFVFYGKEGVMEKIAFDSEEMQVMGRKTLNEIMCRFDDHNKVRLLHAVLGIASEIGELMEALFKHFYEGEPLDDENIAEEFGDNLWYDALAAKYLGHLTLNELMAGNRAKLVARYGETWTQDSALNRDTAGEMKALVAATIDTTDPHPLDSRLHPIVDSKRYAVRVERGIKSAIYEIWDNNSSTAMQRGQSLYNDTYGFGANGEALTVNCIEMAPDKELDDYEEALKTAVVVDTGLPVHQSQKPISATGTCPHCFHDWHEGQLCEEMVVEAEDEQGKVEGECGCTGGPNVE